MPSIEHLDINQAQRKRLSHIDFRVNFLGSITRNDLINRFGIKEAAATRDIAEYRQQAPNNLTYDGVAKQYVRGLNFVPLFEYSASQVLTALTLGFGEDFVGTHKALIACETPTRLSNPSLQVLSVLSRAIHQKKVVSITYQSLSSGKSLREIVPFALVDNGLRWHIRAYDRKRARFTDFVVTRISDPSIVECPIAEHETREFDIQWNRVVELEIIAHPRLTYPETIEFDYGMINKLLNVNVRAAVAGYVLRIWNVDCSKNHNLDREEIHLWLRNSAALYGVENIFLAPGYESEHKHQV
jgi:hypothetical protein